MILAKLSTTTTESVAKRFEIRGKAKEEDSVRRFSDGEYKTSGSKESVYSMKRGSWCMAALTELVGYQDLALGLFCKIFLHHLLDSYILS